MKHSTIRPSRSRMAPLLALSLVSVLSVLPATAWAQRPCSLPGSSNSAVESLCPMHEGLARLKIRDGWGFVDKSGRVVIEPRFNEVQDFAEGLAAAQQDKQWGFIDKSGQWAVAPAFEDAEMFSGGLAAVERNGKWGYIDRRGQWVVTPAYEIAGRFREGSAVVSEGYQRDLMIDTKGNVIKRFGPDLRVLAYPNAMGLYSAEQKFKGVLQHRNGRRLPLPEAVPYATGAGEGLLVAEKKERRGDKELTLKGAVDLEGRWVTPALFHSLAMFREGLAVASLAAVEPDGRERFGIVDREGKFVVPARYEHIERDKQGWYRAMRPGRSAIDFFDARGKQLGAADCEEASPVHLSGAGDRLWTVFTGCGQVWALHPRAGLIESRMAQPDVAATDDHLLLVDKADDGQDAEEGKPGQPLRFALFDAAGKRVFSSDDPQMQGAQALRGLYSNVTLIQQSAASGPAAKQGAAALPLALLIEDYKTVRVLTHELRVLSDPQWTYEREMGDYRFGGRGEPVEGPLVMKTEEGWGAIDARGQWVVPPIYARLGKFGLGVAFARTHEKELIVARDGKTFDFPKEGRGFERVAPGVLEGWGDRDEVVRIDLASGKETRFKLPDGVRAEAFHGGLAAAESGELWGLINRQGEWVVPARFTRRIEAVLEDETLIGWKSGRAIRRDGSSDTLYGWLSPEGREVAAPDYAAIRYDKDNDALHVTTDARGEGVMARDGRVFIDPLNERVSYLDNGWYALSPKPLNGLIDARGEWAARPADFYWDSNSKRPFVMGQQAGETVLFDNQGRLSTAAAPLPLAEDRPDWWWSQTEGSYPKETTAFYGFDFKEKLRVPHRVPSYQTFSEGVMSFTPREQGRVEQIGLMDAVGKVLGLYPYERIEPMQSGFAMFVQELPVGPKGAQKAQARIGYLDRAGKSAIAPVFEAAQNFSEERAVVVAKGNLGLIDTQGHLLVQGAWMCGREPILVDRQQKVVWPAAARNRKKC